MEVCIQSDVWAPAMRKDESVITGMDDKPLLVPAYELALKAIAQARKTSN
jgi:hypothetical protein